MRCRTPTWLVLLVTGAVGACGSRTALFGEGEAPFGEPEGTPPPGSSAPVVDATVGAHDAPAVPDAGDATPLCLSPGSGDAGFALWAEGFGDGTPGTYSVSDVAVDAEDNVVVVGSFYGSLTIGATTLQSTGNAYYDASYDVFIAKFDAAGKPLFARSFGDGHAQFAQGVAVDPSGGAIYVTGAFTGSLNFGTTPATNLVNPFVDPPGTFGGGPNNVFLAKLDPTGAHVWSKRFGEGTYTSAGQSVTLARNGALVLGGNFGGTIDFTGEPDGGDGGLGSLGGANHPFLAAFTPSGDSVWSRAYGTTGQFVQLWRAAVDSDGNVYFGGNFIGAVDFSGAGPDGGAYVRAACGQPSPCPEDAYVVKVDSSGQHVWSVAIPGTSHSITTAVAADNAGNVAVTGAFSGEIDFDGGATLTLPDAGTWGTFVIGLNAATGGYTGAFALEPGVPSFVTSRVAYNRFGHLLVAASFIGDPDAGQLNTVVAEYDSLNPVWSQTIRGDTNVATALAVTSCSSDAIVGGTFTGTIALPRADGGTISLHAPSTRESTFLTWLSR